MPTDSEKLADPLVPLFRPTPVASDGRPARVVVAIGAAVVALVLSGCGRSDIPLASVRGRITVDGQPLSGALVEFQPEGGSPSYGQTDDDGKYNLRFTRAHEGAMLGQHKVRIRTARSRLDERGNDVVTPEVLPERYHAATELTASVDKSTREVNFDLTGDPRLAAQRR